MGARSYSVTDTEVMINLPGKFHGYFMGTDLYQTRDAKRFSGDPVKVVNAEALAEAYHNAEIRTVGRGICYRLTFPRNESTIGVLEILANYGNWGVAANQDSAFGSDRDQDAYVEMKACDMVTKRCRDIIKVLEK